MAGECLVIVDADRIHDYVFSPHRLRLIRGASALQAELNETDLPRRLREVGGRKIYAGGGTLMARFDDLESAQKFATWAQREYFERTRIATATAVAVEEKPEFRDTIKTGVRRARTKEDRAGRTRVQRRESICESVRGMRNASRGRADRSRAMGVRRVPGAVRQRRAALRRTTKSRMACGQTAHRAGRFPGYLPTLEA